MARAQCLIDSKSLTAGTSAPIRLVYIPETTLPKGSILKFAFNPQKTSSFLSIDTASHLFLGDTKISPEKGSSSSEIFFKLPKALEEGGELVFEGKANAPTFSQRRYPIALYVDIKGKNQFKDLDPDYFHIDIKGGMLAKVSVRTHAIVVAKNERFDIFVRYEDAYGNTTNFAPDGTRIEISHHNLRRDSLSWQLFVSETGITPIYQLYFNEPGNYSYELKIVGKEQSFHSDPIKCLQNADYHYYAGVLAGDPQKPSAKISSEATFRYFRDEMCHHFTSLSPFEEQIGGQETAEMITYESWKHVEAVTAVHNEDTRFAAFLGFFWQGEVKEEGLRLMIYNKDHKPLLAVTDGKSSSLKKIYKSHTKGELLSIPVMTMAKPFLYDFSSWDNDFERLVEIYSASGSMEGLEAFTSKKSDPLDYTGSVVQALNHGCRFGFIASGRIDRGPIHAFNENRELGTPGLTIVLASEETRQSFFDAMSARRTYATTGERIVLDFRIADLPMGSELNVENKPGFKYLRPITGFAMAASPIKSIIIVRNGKICKEWNPKESSFDFSYEDEENYKNLTLKNEESAPFIYYYLRVELENGHMAWSSPIWIDYEQEDRLAKTDSKKARKK